MKRLIFNLSLVLFATLIVGFFASRAHATLSHSGDLTPLTSKCKIAAKKIAHKAADKKYSGVSTETRTTTGAKLLNHGDRLETYLVGVSDEVDPSDWIVVVDKNCKTKFVGVSTESSSEFTYPGEPENQ